MSVKPGWKWVSLIFCVILALFLYWHKREAASDQEHTEGSASKEASSEGQGKKGGRGGKGGRKGMGGPVAVRVVKAEQGEMDRTIEALGTVTPIATVTIRSRVEGVLEHIYFKEGQEVQAGHVIAEIQREPFLIQLKQAQGTLDKDKATLVNAKIDLARYQTLLTQEAGSRQQRDTQLSLVRQLEGAVKTDQAAVDTAKLQLSYTRIVAPITGRIGLRQLDAGNLIRAGDTSSLAVMTQIKPITVLFTIPQDRLSQVTDAMFKNPLQVNVFDRNASTLRTSGTLAAVDNQVDPTTGTVKLRANFDNKDNKLFPNQFVNISLRVEHLNNVLILPVAAVQHGTPGAFVYVVKSDQHSVEMRTVTEGLSQNGNVMITKGLSVGESVVIEGVDNLRDGAKVNIITPKASTSNTQSADESASAGQASSQDHKGRGRHHRAEQQQQ